MPAGVYSSQVWSSGMSSDFGTGTAKNDIFSIYADYIPIKIAGNTSVYSSTDTSEYRMAVPYTMTENGVINSISIYHNGDSGDCILAVYSDYEGEPAVRLATTDAKAVNSAAFMADTRAYKAGICRRRPEDLACMGVRE
jgi:hypothetical protein